MAARLGKEQEDQQGIVVEIFNDNTGLVREVFIDLNHTGAYGDISWQPSDRVLKRLGTDRKGWEENTLVYSEWLGEYTPVKQVLGYFREDQASYEAAVALVEALNKGAK